MPSVPLSIINWFLRSVFTVRLALAIGATLASVVALANSSIDYPGMIPLASDAQQATDIVSNAKQLTPDDIAALIQQPNGSYTVSNLDPDTTTMVWQNKLGGQLNPQNYTLGLPTNPNRSIYRRRTEPYRESQIARFVFRQCWAYDQLHRDRRQEHPQFYDAKSAFGEARIRHTAAPIFPEVDRAVQKSIRQADLSHQS